MAFIIFRHSITFQTFLGLHFILNFFIFSAPIRRHLQNRFETKKSWLRFRGVRRSKNFGGGESTFGFLSSTAKIGAEWFRRLRLPTFSAGVRRGVRRRTPLLRLKLKLCRCSEYKITYLFKKVLRSMMYSSWRFNSHLCKNSTPSY